MSTAYACFTGPTAYIVSVTCPAELDVNLDVRSQAPGAEKCHNFLKIKIKTFQEIASPYVRVINVRTHITVRIIAIMTWIAPAGQQLTGYKAKIAISFPPA